MWVRHRPCRWTAHASARRSLGSPLLRRRGVGLAGLFVRLGRHRDGRGRARESRRPGPSGDDRTGDRPARRLRDALRSASFELRRGRWRTRTERRAAATDDHHQARSERYAARERARHRCDGDRQGAALERQCFRIARPQLQELDEQRPLPDRRQAGVRRLAGGRRHAHARCTGAPPHIAPAVCAALRRPSREQRHVRGSRGRTPHVRDER